MNTYISQFFNNGRIAVIPTKDFDEAIKQNKEILIFCGGWSGGYACAIGANKSFCPNLGECWEMYSYSVKEETFSAEDMQKFHKVVVTDGIKVYMKTGEPATSYFGDFADWSTSFEKFKQSYIYNNETKEDFEKMRFAVDVEKTQRMLNNPEIWESIRGYFLYR